MILRIIYIFISAIFCVGLTSKAHAEKIDYYQEYIDKYSATAIEEQAKAGIPASITLAQGLLESAAGRSTLATRGNNHFGIKCHNDWTGDTLLRNDDAANECFRVYNNPEQSFADHSKFLLRKRYSSLFDNDVTDYAAWAHGLRSCGYATDPNYANRLIAIIERYSLYLFDTEAGRQAEQTAGFIRDMLSATHPVRKTRGLHYVIAAPGDTYESIAKELGIDKEKLLAFNDVQKNCEIKPWEEVYLQEKNTTAPDGISSATIGEDESIHSIAQRFGIKISEILKLNPKAKDHPGTLLRLR